MIGEPLGARWSRRALSFSGYGLLFVVLVGLSPALFAVALLVDVWRRSRLARVRTLAMAICYLSCELLGLAAAGLLWLRGGEREAFLDRNFRLQAWWAGTLFALARRLFSFDVDVEGASLCTPGPVVILIRHVSVADTLLPVALLSRPFGVRLRYVLKRELLWDPCLDVVGNRLPNAFVRRGGGDTAREAETVGSLLVGLGPRDGVLIFPEGTRATPERRRRVLAELAASTSANPELVARAQRLRHLLPPRLGGLASLLDGTREAPTDVVFVGHCGFEGIRSWADMTSGALVGRRIRIKLWRHSAAALPPDRDARLRWVLDEWQRLDDWIDGQLATAPA